MQASSGDPDFNDHNHQQPKVYSSTFLRPLTNTNIALFIDVMEVGEFGLYLLLSQTLHTLLFKLVFFYI